MENRLGRKGFSLLNSDAGNVPRPQGSLENVKCLESSTANRTDFDLDKVSPDFRDKLGAEQSAVSGTLPFLYILSKKRGRKGYAGLQAERGIKHRGYPH